MNMNTIAGGLGAAALCAAIAVAAMLGLPRAAADPAATGAAVRAYLLEHPEVIPEAMERLQDKQTASLVSGRRSAIETAYPGAVLGNPRGDITLVEYFDYACGYCRASLADVDKLVATDPGVRVVLKELPILSPYSDHAARMSLVAAGAGKFAAYHHALYGAGALSDEKVDATAKTLGLDPAAADKPQIAKEIETNLETARSLRLSGTPTFVVGDQIMAGAVGYQALKDAVTKARSTKA
jgi:protein-disulfide isomerase